MDRKFFSVLKKLEIVNHAEIIGNISATAKAHNVQSNQIRYRKHGKENLIEKTKTVIYYFHSLFLSTFVEQGPL